jgi:hypothetical protein
MTCTSSSTFPTWHNSIIISNSIYNNSATYSNNILIPILIPILLQWPDWHENISIPNIIQERIEAENARIEESRRIQIAEYETRKLSSEKAKQLLLDHLTPDQRDMVEKNGWFVIEGGKTGKRYRIKSGTVTGNVEELDNSEKTIAKYCCHLNHQYPHSDHHLAQKLMIEWDEEEFLRKANRTAVG